MHPTPARDTVVTITDAAGHEVTLSGVDVEYTDTPDARLLLPSDLERFSRVLERLEHPTPEELERLAQDLIVKLEAALRQADAASDRASEAPTGTVTPRTHEHHPYRWPQPRGRRR
jgi:hypothetical protein